MSDNFNKMTMEERIAWVTLTDERIQNMYKELSAFEELANVEPDANPAKLFQVIDTLKKVQAEIRAMRNSNVLVTTSNPEELRQRLELLKSEAELLALAQQAKREKHEAPTSRFQ